jgi:uncharacterized protein YegL
MKPHEQLLNDNIVEIIDILLSRPQIREFVHLSIIEFNTKPHLLRGMSDALEGEITPRVTCGGTTNYGAMLELVRDRINVDVPSLSSVGVNVLRPFVIFLTDGAPTDATPEAWLGPLRRLLDKEWRRYPHTMSYGFGNAGEDVLKKISTLRAFTAEESIKGSVEALSSALNSVLRSLVASAQRKQLQIPEDVSGFRSIPLDDGLY